jgi:microcompartment protein CcmK/EutM
MKDAASTIQITFRKGRPLAAYLRIRGTTVKVARTKKVTSSLLVDFDDSGNPVGLEILAFDSATVGRINRVLVSLGQPALPKGDLAPLRAA